MLQDLIGFRVDESSENKILRKQQEKLHTPLTDNQFHLLSLSEETVLNIE